MRKVTVSITISLLLLLGLFLKPTVQVSATSDTDTIRIELYKLLIDVDEIPDELENNGNANPFDSPNHPLLYKYKGLNGVTYGAFDVTDAFYELRSEGKSNTEAQTILSLKNMDDESPLMSKETMTVNNQDGVAEFDLPIFDSEGRYRAYLFKDMSSSLYYQAPSAQLVVILPVVGNSGEILEVIKLFPKQVGRRYTPPTLVKNISTHDVSYGEKIHYSLLSKVPGDVWTYDTFTIKDQADKRLVLERDSLKVLFEGEEIDSKLLNISYEDHGFQIKFKPMELQPYADKILTIEYDMYLVDGAEADTAFINTASLKTDKDFLEREQWVKTGGFNFLKVDRVDQTKVLEGATFVIKNKEGLYLKDDEKNSWVDVKGDVVELYQKEKLRTITSDKDGTFKISGLAYGEYELQEVVAPEGYILSKIGVPFNIEEGTWQLEQGKVLPLKVINEPVTNKPTNPPKTTKPVVSPKKPSLPKTNEVLNQNNIAVGVSLITIALVCLMKIHRNKLTEKGE